MELDEVEILSLGAELAFRKKGGAEIVFTCESDEQCEKYSDQIKSALGCLDKDKSIG
jgi:hypothetical protein